MNRTIALLLATSLLFACSDEPDESAAVPTPQAAAEEAPNEVPKVVEIKGPAIGEIAKKVGAALPAIAKTSGDHFSKQLKGAGNDKKVLKGLYGEATMRFYALDGNLTDDGTEVMELLQSLDRHGVDRRGYRLSQIDKATEDVIGAFKAERAAILKAAGDNAGAAKVAAEICAWIRSDDGGEIRLVRAGGDKLDGKTRKQLGENLQGLIDAAAKTREVMWTADIEIARAVIRYVVDFKFAVVAHPYDAMTPSQVRGLAAKEHKKITEILAKSRDKTAATLRALWPTHPQYAKLLGAVDRYKSLVVKGGWEKLPKLPRKKIDKGFRGPWVEKLRKRLIAEGYKAAPAGDTYDKELRSVVEQFQARHQLKEDGVIGKTGLKELNVTAEKRLREIGLALQRWREAQGRDPAEYFVWVNISGQRMQVYDKGKVLRTHRVIVGKNNDDIDFSAKLKGKLNRTKMFSAKMTKVTLAPRWYPTPRVVDIELGPALARDPDYYEKEGYVSEMQEDGSEKVYQKSGPTNLLGRVKFQFPNKHAIYMHDTPGRRLFKRARRAYSHGCIRLHKPMSLAYFLLGRDHRKWNKKRINKIVDEREEKIVFLKRKIPVHIDYVSVSVDDGKINFWSDIYGYDVAFFTGQLPVEDTEEYEPKTFKGIR